MSRSAVLAATLGLAIAGLSTAANAATLVVNTVLDTQDASAGNGLCADAAGSCSLRAAITEANALAGADIINLPAGTYTSTLVSANDNNNLGGDFDVNSDMTINGADSATTIVQAASAAGVASERVFHLRNAGQKVLNDLTIRYGRTAVSDFGAGILVEVSAVIATLNRVVIANNEGGANGGGLAISSAAASITTLNTCRVENNSAGGIVSSGSSGAGIFLLGASNSLNISDSSITGNAISNQGNASAAGVYSTGILNITNSVVSNNTATSVGGNTFAGGINLIGGTTTILGSTISGNVSTVAGGPGSGFAAGIANQDGNLNLVDSTVSGNTASRFHAGIRTIATGSATLTTITNSTISENMAVGEGGGVVNYAVGSGAATITINGSTLHGNSTNGVGGGLENFSNSTGLAVVNVTNSTLSANTAASGAGSYNTGANSSVNFNYVTIAGNTATSSGGGVLQNPAGSTKLKNSIVADNAAATGPDIAGVVTSQGYNHVENVTGATFTALGGDISGIDPQLWSLANNGGSTLTHLPASTSPVIDTIPNGISDCGTVVSTSQNGLTRPQLAGCEKGSVETNPQFIFRNGFDGA